MRKFTMLASIGVQPGEEGTQTFRAITAPGIKLKEGEMNETMILFQKSG